MNRFIASALIAATSFAFAALSVSAQEAPSQSLPGNGSVSAPPTPAPAPPGQRPGAPADTAPPAAAPTAVAVPKAPGQLSVVRVNVTQQPWNFLQPWGKRPPFSRRAIGAVLSGKRVLVTGEAVANATYVELESPEGGAKTPATVEAVDYECNLAVLKAEDESFLDHYKPLQLTEAKVGDSLSVWQLESTGVLLVTKGPLTTVEVSAYPQEEYAFLVYRGTFALQFRDSSFVLPVVKDDKLVGLIARYDNSSNSAEVIPTPVIQHFLKDAADSEYQGFPKAGLGFANTRDPQLRRYVGLNGNGTGGVYVTDVLKNGPAAKAGIEEGDVILSLDGHPIDQDGNYDDPAYGKIALIHLLSTKHYVGDKVKLTLLRKGEKKDVTVQLERRSVESYVSEPYVIDRAPKYYILGGLVLQELSRQYLREFGGDWRKRAPQELVHFDRYQNDLFEKGPKKIVILSRVLPTPVTRGYEDLRSLRVTRINGVQLQSLDDVPEALTKSTNGLHRVEFDTDPSVIFLDAERIAAEEPDLMRAYRVQETKRLN